MTIFVEYLEKAAGTGVVEYGLVPLASAMIGAVVGPFVSHGLRVRATSQEAARRIRGDLGTMHAQVRVLVARLDVTNGILAQRGTDAIRDPLERLGAALAKYGSHDQVVVDLRDEEVEDDVYSEIEAVAALRLRLAGWHLPALPPGEDVSDQAGGASTIGMYAESCAVRARSLHTLISKLRRLERWRWRLQKAAASATR